ncbi:MAG: ATPase, T2SS/T4P/T4SS family [Coriobacteriia bacterium]|nr:ATPase, T2SS/T4P/T4SS family [Coriobacteriia bacterium]
MAYTREKLGELLIKAGVLDEDQLTMALEIQSQNGGKLGRILVDQLIVNEEQLADILATQKGIPRITLANYPIDREAVAVLPERVARRRTIMPLNYAEDGAIVVAMSDPLDIEALDEIEVRSGRRAVPVVTTATEILFAIDKFMTQQDAVAEIVDLKSMLEAEPEESEVDAKVVAGGDVPIVRLVNQIIKEALLDRASDIHFEPFEKDIRVRYRVDGVLHEVMRLPKSARPEITSRIKIMADMNITERRRPQDGRIQLRVEDRPVDLRVATLPTPHGESITIRVLSQGLAFYDLEDLGMNEEHLKQMNMMLRKPYGAILVAGPTGSGKSTTLYAGLKRINDETRKIITVEEPVEYQMNGVTQIGVNNAIGLTFASGLRQILRSDPDVVMIGEIRDPETAETAVRAALTGHVVLSSIHTNDAPSALTRLSDMRVPSYITSSALIAVLAQRLVRRLCPDCKALAKHPDEWSIEQLGLDEKAALKLKPYGPVGCDKCLKTGYKGRVGIFELMPIDDELRKLFLHDAPAEALRVMAIEHGMRTLREDAFEKVSSGMTSIEEVARVIM